MYTLTFRLKNREKTYTSTSIESAYETFLIGYGEALNELEWVHTFSQDGQGAERIDADLFRKQYRHIEDKVGDNVTETMMKGGA